MEPWANCEWIAYQGNLPPLTFIQGEWCEQEHSRIIEIKDRIETVESQEEWELRKKLTNPYEAIFSGGDVTFPSLANAQPLSRSYFKMIEMLNVCDFWNDISKEKAFHSAHICEGPGGFLQCTVEQAKQHKIQNEKFFAMTLRPIKSHIPGWRRSVNFLRKYPQIQLEYGVDDTGNILVPANQQAFCKRAAGAQLFTADGGFDFSIDYTNQEQMSYPLLLASFTIGLGCLAKGGTLIIKLFDMYSNATKDLLIGTAKLFKQFTIYKPATSRPCNSERYFMAKGYVGQSSAIQWIRHLQDAQIKHAQQPIQRLISGSWPSNILNAFQEQIDYQESQQIQTLTESLELDKNTIPDKILKCIQASKKWCEVFRVPTHPLSFPQVP
jgi:23S rRNA U2552 (ribose-2'-O)-methylase RlmE/FtsJ